MTCRTQPKLFWHLVLFLLCLALPRLSLGQQIPVKSLQQDFQILRHALEEAHGGIYRYTTKSEIDRIFDQAYRKLDHPSVMNGGSFSSSTEFLTLLHFSKRAQFIGEEPAGAYYGYTCGRMVKPVLPNSKLELNFGVLTFYLDVSGYKYPDRGVMPDYPVAHTITDLLAGRDTDMELAISLARAPETSKGRKDR